ncbi:hypothetical protein [Breoghania sp. L-A4]|uniref:hypothetical protein n=1 Tax=Breoghania sp. L-A4 TaxID=2304600 RepID=UPI0019688A5E|nr:hypothetical protein [Breoghania sp. L-A4]
MINAAVDALRNVPGVHALFLAGSHGAGLQDKCSDIDFLAVVTEPAAAGFSDLWRETLGGNILLWRERPGQVINAIVGDWVRIDVRFIAPAQLAGLSRDRLKPLFDHDEIYGTLPAVAPPPALDKEKMSWQVEEFIRILGLLPVAMGRGEYINGVTGLGFLRGLLIDLLIAETGAPHRGGALHLNRLITAEHKAILTALPPWCRSAVP